MTASYTLVLDNTEYLHKQMQRHFPDLNPMRANDRSNIVYFNNTVSDDLKTRWILSTIRGSEQRGASLAHVVVTCPTWIGGFWTRF